MAIFKKKQKSIDIIQLEDIENFIENYFKESKDYTNYLKIKEKFDYETDKLKKYAELLLNPDFEKRIIQDKDYFKKRATKINNIIISFLEKTIFPDSVLDFSKFIETSIQLTEKLDDDLTIPINKLEEVMPKLISRIKLKVEALGELIADFNKFLNSINIELINKIRLLISEYYSLEKKIETLNQERIPVLDELTQITLMRDRVELRLNSLKEKRNMASLVVVMEKRDSFKKRLCDLKSLIEVKLSYINELLDENDYSEIKAQLNNFISLQAKEVTPDFFSELKKVINKISSKNKDLNLIIIDLFSLEDKIIYIDGELKKINSKLHDNILYLRVKEQEDSYDLWNSKFISLRKKVQDIDNIISDISLNLIKQKLNEELQKLSSITVIE